MKLFDVKLTNDGDIELDFNSNVSYVYGTAMVEQSVKCILSLWRGEWFADRSLGVDWPNVLKNRVAANMLAEELTSAIYKIPTINYVDGVFVTRDSNRGVVIEYILSTTSERLSSEVVI